ncbi:NAD-dependent epimerase/dehydratase family protein [Hyunsoonleella pacifica]|uniref:NAD-dependent epimerase/dehydratase family protein n=1 Tax=Hyunsoonleella pacifica TaxID=1080224 RepID=A0A4V2JAZ1_9FLAO|nr:NAD-dependent epimerase/dehydratase family protein [Hyunsoonleella pacifica]TBN15695.1 NAD-dependent epimerase/dehydratase family protein [Hyunsoonleella pacifica]GGD21878.1 NAD-dependent epimerase [Hyunsoonleella pacifica]
MILVTGGTGLVGAHLLHKLTSNNETVRAIYRTERKLQNVKDIFSCYGDTNNLLFDKIEWVKTDILDVPALSEALNGISYVYHCAAFVSFEPDKYQLLRQTNIEGTANIVNLCISNNIKKICYVSSIATIGNPIKRDNAITEETHWNPEDDNSVYAITKYGAEMEVWRGTQEGLDAVIVNPGVILAAGIWHYGSGSLFKKVYNGLKYYTSGSIGLVSVKDVVDVMIQLLKSDIKNERYILVAENWSYKTFLKTTAKALKVKPPKKLAKPWLLKIGWRLDWLKRKLTGKRRVLTKQVATSLTTKTNYRNSKVTKALGYKFQSIDDVISEIANQYLKQAQ